MNSHAFLKHVEKLFKRIHNTLYAKNVDYAGYGNRPFFNFEMAEMHKLASVEQGIAVRLGDKYSRLCNLLHSKETVAGETLLDTIEDAIGYLAILHAVVKERRS